MSLLIEAQLTEQSKPSVCGGVFRLAVALSVTLVVGCAASGPSAPGEATVTVFAQGGLLHGSNGVIFGPDGNLYIASVSSSTVLGVDPESGEVVERWGPEQGVSGPDDLIFGPDGSLFWTDILVGDVGKRLPDGTTSVVASPGPGVNPITFSDDWRLFVSQCFLGDHLFEIDPNGLEEPRLISDQLGPGCGMNGMDWGPDGKLYGPRWFHGEVARIDVDSGDLETVATGFGIPAAVKFDSEGRLHVLDTQVGEVVRVDIVTGEKEVVGRPGVAKDNLAFNADDRLFVSSFSDSSILEVIGLDTNRVVVPGGISTPGGLAYLPSSAGSGRLFVADGGALRQLDPSTGTEVHTVQGFVTDLGLAHSAHPRGEHLVITAGATVTIWNPDTDEVVSRFESFDRAVDALAFGEDIIVSEFGTGSVVRFSPDAPDTRTTLASGFEQPAGLASHDGDLYVADRTGAVFQILNDGEVLDMPRPVVIGLAGPEGIAVAEDGSLYVVEVDAERVTWVDPESGATSLVADGLNLSGLEREAISEATPIAYLSGIAIGDGSLFVSNYPENRIYRIQF
jgi:sugar lactone lactonase YvrE